MQASDDGTVHEAAYSELLLQEAARDSKNRVAGLSAGAPLRLLHLLSQQPGKTGSGVYLQAVVKQAAAARAKQQVVVGMPADAPQPEIPPLRSDEIHTVRFDTADLPFPIAGMSDVMPYSSTRFASFTPAMREAYLKAFTRVLQPVVQHFKPDIIHTHHLWLMTALTRRLFPEIPIVTSCHGTELRQLTLAKNLAPFVRPACAQIDAVLALHRLQIQELQAAYSLLPENIHLIGAGYREDIFCLDDATRTCEINSDQTINLLYAGKISAPKGVPWLLEAMHQIQIPRGWTVHLSLAGSAGRQRSEDIFPMQMPPGVHIEYLGALNQEALAATMQKCHLFILPSFFEGLPLVLLEAMACGCRLVVTDLPGLDSWLPAELSECGMVERIALPPLTSVDQPVPDALPSFVTHLAAGISRQIERISARQATPPSEALACIQQMSWPHVYSKIERVYRLVLQRRENYI